MNQKYKKFPEYIQKTPWKFDIERLQKELQPIKPFFVEWDRNTSPELGLTSKAMSFLHSKDCPDEEKHYQAIYSWTPRRPIKDNHRHFSVIQNEYNFKGWVFNGTTISSKKKESRHVVQEDVGVFNEDYKHTEYYNVYKELSKYYVIDKFRIIMLPPFTTVPWHTDNYENLHVPIETNIGCRFVIDNLSYYLPADGSTYQSENCFFHTIYNAGSTERYNILVSITDYKKGSYKLCHHFEGPGLRSRHSELSYIAKPIKEVSPEDLWEEEDYK